MIPAASSVIRGITPLGDAPCLPVVRWHAPVPGKYAALVIVSFAATLGLYETLVRRFRITRLLFGMKPLSGLAPRPTSRRAPG